MSSIFVEKKRKRQGRKERKNGGREAGRETEQEEGKETEFKAALTNSLPSYLLSRPEI